MSQPLVDRLQRPSWNDRSFPFGLPHWMLADLIERLRGTAPRLQPLLAELKSEQLHRTDDGSWSIAQNVGHLGDTEELWIERFDDLAAGRETYTPADPARFASAAEKHIGVSIEETLARFVALRNRWIAMLESAPAPLQLADAYHARLDARMRLVDCAQFAAHHDDNHLLRIRQLRAEFGAP